MSLNIDPLRTVLIQDKQLNFNDEAVFPVYGAPSFYSQRVYNALSYSDSAISFNTPPPSPYITVSRKVWISYKVRMSYTSTLPVGQTIFTQGQFALQSFPLSQCMQTLKVNINNSSSTYNLTYYISALLRYRSDFMTKHIDWSMCPSMLDNIGDYNFALGTNRNVLGNWGDDSYEFARGSWPITIVANPVSAGAPITATIEFQACEPCFVSPLVFGRWDASGLIGVQTNDFQITIGDLERFISFAGAVAPTLSSFTFLDAPKLHFDYLTPKPNMKIPEIVNYTYHQINYYITTGQNVLSDGNPVTITSNNIQLSSIPEYLMIYARRKQNVRANNVPDVALGLTQMSISWNNKTGILSAASQQQLYQICVKNGYMGSFIEWSGLPIWNAAHTAYSAGSGSYFMMSSCELGLDPGQAGGVLGTYNLLLTATFINNTGLPMDVDLFVIAVTPSVWTVSANRSISSTGVLSHADVLKAEQSPQGYTVIDTMVGGNFLSKIPWNKIGNAFKDYILPAASIAVPLAMGLGDKQEGGLAVTGGRPMTGKQVKKKLVGRY